MIWRANTIQHEFQKSIHFSCSLFALLDSNPFLQLNEIIESALLETRVTVGGKIQFLYMKSKDPSGYLCTVCNDFLALRILLFEHNRLPSHSKNLQKLEEKNSSARKAKKYAILVKAFDRNRVINPIHTGTAVKSAATSRRRSTSPR